MACVLQTIKLFKVGWWNMSETLAWCGIDLKWAYTDVLRRIGRRTACVQRAKDILHDALVFFAVSSHPAREESPQAYLNGIVNHLLVDEFRHRTRFVDEDQIDEAALILECTPEQLYETRQKLHHLQRVVDLLPEKCRQVFWLYHVDEMKQREIAVQLGISTNMVEKHLIRAMLDIRAFQQAIH
jgi:RNA polymerase sigma factor (sigma-70 family)